LTIKSTKYGNSKDIKIPYCMQFEGDGANLIRKPGKTTQGVKIPWTTL
jgi:hypothetical protein